MELQKARTWVTFRYALHTLVDRNDRRSDAHGDGPDPTGRSPGGASRPNRPDLQGARLRCAAVRPGPLARGRHGLHHRGAPSGWRPVRNRPLRRRDRRAQRARRRRPRLVPPGAESAARHRRLRLVGGRQATADLHQHAARCGARTRAATTGCSTSRSGALDSKVGGHERPESLADVREVLARRDPRRLRARATTSTSSAWTTARITQLTTDGSRDDHQRHVRLGLRGGARRPRRLPLEPRRPAHRLLAVRHDRRRHLLADQQHRHALPGDHAHSVSEGRHDELRGAHRRRQRRRRPTTLDEDARRSAQHLSGAPRVDRRRHRRDPAAESAAEPQRLPARRRRDRRGARASFATSRRRGSTSSTRCRGSTSGRAFLWLSERDGWQHVYRVPRDGGERRPADSRRFDADVTDVVGRRREGRLAVFPRLARQRDAALSVSRRGSTAPARPSGSRRPISPARTRYDVAPGRPAGVPHLLALRHAAA